MLSSQMHLLGTLTLSEWYHDEERVYSVLVTMTATECIAVTASNNREGLAKPSFPLKPLFVFMLIAVISWNLVFSGLKWYQMNSGSWPIQYRVGGWACARTHGYGGQRSTLNVFPCHSPSSFLRWFFFLNLEPNNRLEWLVSEPGICLSLLPLSPGLSDTSCYPHPSHWC